MLLSQGSIPALTGARRHRPSCRAAARGLGRASSGVTFRHFSSRFSKEESMKRVMVLTVAFAAAVLLTVPALAQGQWVRGPVTAMGTDTVTVTVKGVEHTFKIQPTTQVFARGGTTAMKGAEQGKPAPKLGDFVKVGTNVELHYNEAGGAKVATEIHVIPGGGEAASSEPAAVGASFQGIVVSVTADTLVVKEGSKEMKFAVSAKTRITGTGASTKTLELKAANKPAVITEFVKPNDRVVVNFEEGAAPTATAVRITQKAFK
jgi:hypothetical protein